MYQTDKASCIYTTSSDTLTPNLDCEAEVPTDYVEKDTIFKLSEVVCATLKNQKFIDAIIPSITDKVMDMIWPQIELIIEERIEPHAQAIRHQEHILSLKEKQIDEQNADIKALKTKLDKAEARLEEQEQYSRRTSLRFHNVPVPTDGSGKIDKPIDTDAIVLKICKNQLKVPLEINDIGRSHPIGEMKDGKISIIVRFLSYRQRQMVFSSKRKLKGNSDKTFIAENLTRHRYDLLNRLNTLRKKEMIHSFWTHDGSLIVKAT